MTIIVNSLCKWSMCMNDMYRCWAKCSYIIWYGIILYAILTQLLTRVEGEIPCYTRQHRVDIRREKFKRQKMAGSLKKRANEKDREKEVGENFTSRWYVSCAESSTEEAGHVEQRNVREVPCVCLVQFSWNGPHFTQLTVTIGLWRKN